ncbi:hypothetical protein Golob_002534, partial [Gossypium lobatum]|nr:hypothetical protein [Gossypium lobatum]
GHQDWCVGAWKCFFGIIAWCFWKNRNLFIFYRITWSVNETIKVSLSWACLNIDRSVRNEGGFTMAGAILDGLTLLCECGFGRVSIGTDNLENVRHISREDNQDVDRMVKLTHCNSYDLCLYETSLLGEMF